LKINLDRHGPRPLPNIWLLPDPHCFSFPPTFKHIFKHLKMFAVHCKKGYHISPPPAACLSLTKILPGLEKINYSRSGSSSLVIFRLGTWKSVTFFTLYICSHPFVHFEGQNAWLFQSPVESEVNQGLCFGIAVGFQTVYIIPVKVIKVQSKGQLASEKKPILCLFYI
jgi:hypothetical protein